MAARNRPRSGFVKEDREDAHEEKAMWEQIVRDLEKCKAVNDRAKEVSKLIIEKEEKMLKRKHDLGFYIRNVFQCSRCMLPPNPFRDHVENDT